MSHPSTSGTGTQSQQQQQQQVQTQHFLLKWNNHRTNLVNVFEHLLQHDNLVDVTLAIEGKFLKAHKIVLSACSPYFQAMFINQAPEDKHPILIFHDLKFGHMKTLLEFMYRGEISIDERDLSDVLKIAEALSIRGLSSFESDEDDSSGTDAAPNSPPMSTGSNTNASFHSQNEYSSSSQTQSQQPPSIIIPSLAQTQQAQSSSQQDSNSSSRYSEGDTSSVGGTTSGVKPSGTKSSNKALNGSTKPAATTAKGLKTIKKEKLKKASSTTGTSVVGVSSNNATATVQANPLTPSPSNDSKVHMQPSSSAPSIDLEVSASKKKRGRKAVNKGKALDETAIEVASSSSITSSTQASITSSIIAAVAAAAAQKSPKMGKKSKGSTSSIVHNIDIQMPVPPPPTPISPPHKPVRRRIPKRVSQGAPTADGSSVKQSRLVKSEPGSMADDYNNGNGYGDLSSSSEPLSEMSVRGLDLFKYAAIEDGIYRCMECEKLQIPKTFKNKYSFQRHAFLYHEGNMRKVFPCPVCYREFSRPDKMKNHLRSIHEGQGTTTSNGNGTNECPGGGGGGGKSMTSPGTDFSTSGVGVSPYAGGIGARLNEHCDF